MKIHLVSFATTIEDIGYPDTELRQLRLIDSAKKYGINSFFTWNRQQILKIDFYKQNKEILDLKKGAGYWLWKPYIILDTLSKVKDGEFVFYIDNSFYFINSPNKIIEICSNNNGFCFFNRTKNTEFGCIKHHSHNECINLLEAHNVINESLSIAGIQLYQKNNNTINFITEYLNLCLNKTALLDSNQVQNKVFLSHLHDMSIYSILRAKKGINGFRSPYQSGNHLKLEKYRVKGEFLSNGVYLENDVFENSPYPQIFEWDKDGFNCKRPLTHYFTPSKVIGYIKRKLNNAF